MIAAVLGGGVCRSPAQEGQDHTTIGNYFFRT
uniref:Uncharacterized protein n=1 Tax=Rhizophora mucronata TaxID=61149 RepID=A0A2P2NSU8_RHIMU